MRNQDKRQGTRSKREKSKEQKESYRLLSRETRDNRLRHQTDTWLVYLKPAIAGSQSEGHPTSCNGKNSKLFKAPLGWCHLPRPFELNSFITIHFWGSHRITRINNQDDGRATLKSRAGLSLYTLTPLFIIRVFQILY